MIAEATEPMVSRPFRVDRTWMETHDTFSLELHPLDGGDFTFLPGQFNMLYQWGIGEVPISISGHPAATGKAVHTIRAVGSVTKMMRQLRRGDVVGVRGPYGTPWPVADIGGQDIVIITGGIGLAPLRPVMYHLLQHRDRYGKILMLYGARTPDDLLYVKELEQWRGRFDMHVSVTVDRAESSWRGNVGVVTGLMPGFHFDQEMTIAMVCGPEIMMRFTIQELSKRGIPAENIFVSMERNMKCGIGLCGHCQFGPDFICKDGPVFRYDRIKDRMLKREL
jgi:NAD(P)H-flavin reductase